MRIDLYHRTTPEAAAAIMRQRTMVTKENGHRVFFSTVPDGQAAGYGDAVIHVRIPEHLAHLDDEFPDGEQHYWVDARRLTPEHFVDENHRHAEATP